MNKIIKFEGKNYKKVTYGCIEEGDIVKSPYTDWCLAKISIGQTISRSSFWEAARLFKENHKQIHIIWVVFSGDGPCEESVYQVFPTRKQARHFRSLRGGKVYKTSIEV